jgi:membrane protein
VTTTLRNRLALLGRFLIHVGRRFVDDNCFNLAASLAYTTLLALVPLVTIALTVISAFPVFREFTQGLDDFFGKHMLPPTVAKAVTGYIDQFTRSAGRLTAVGVVFLAVTAIMLMTTIERAFNAIWRVRRPRPLVLRVLMYWGVLTLGPLLIGLSLTVTSYAVSASLGLAGQIPGGGTALVTIAPVVLTAVAFTLVYYVVPNRPMELKHAVIGGLAATVMFEAMKRGFALYLANFPTYTLVYGAFAVIPVFLIWIYASWVVALLGAVIAAAAPDFRVAREARELQGRLSFAAALEILRVLIRAQRASRTPRTREILSEARAPREAGERVLEELAAAGWVARVVGDRWTLACDPGVVTIAEVFRRLVFEPAGGKGGAADAVLDGVIQRAAAGLDRAIALPIRTLVEEAGEPAPRRDMPPRRQDRRGMETL